MKIVTPPLTRDIVRIQKDYISPLQGDKILAHKDIKLGKFVHKSKKYTEKELFDLALNSTEYPFTVHFKEFDLNIVANSYKDYKFINKALGFILDHKDKPSKNQPLHNLSKITRKELERVKDL